VKLSFVLLKWIFRNNWRFISSFKEINLKWQNLHEMPLHLIGRLRQHLMKGQTKAYLELLTMDKSLPQVTPSHNWKGNENGHKKTAKKEKQVFRGGLGWWADLLDKTIHSLFKTQTHGKGFILIACLMHRIGQRTHSIHNIHTPLDYKLHKDRDPVQSHSPQVLYMLGT
jgi:hypothetical protein